MNRSQHILLSKIGLVLCAIGSIVAIAKKRPGKVFVFLLLSLPNLYLLHRNEEMEEEDCISF